MTAPSKHYGSALKHHCYNCGADAGQPCRSQHSYRRQALKRPHKVRVVVAKEAKES